MIKSSEAQVIAEKIFSLKIEEVQKLQKQSSDYLDKILNKHPLYIELMNLEKKFKKYTGDHYYGGGFSSCKNSLINTLKDNDPKLAELQSKKSKLNALNIQTIRQDIMFDSLKSGEGIEELFNKYITKYFE